MYHRYFVTTVIIYFPHPLRPVGEDKAAAPVTDTEFSQSVNPQSFCTGVSLHHPALIQNTGPLIDMSDIRPGTSEYFTYSRMCIEWKDVILQCNV